MNKNFYAILGAILILGSCAAGRGTSSSVNRSAATVGGDKDKHGCIASAGYTWCQVQGRCVRLWEEGIKMENVNGLDNKNSAKFNSYLLFALDSNMVELFDTKQDKPLILKQVTSNSNTWVKGDFSIKKVSGKWVVMNGNKIVNIEVK